jgi:UDP-N-acetylmuramoyl-tripeptide--D-alanyl-D-alanine ligase
VRDRKPLVLTVGQIAEAMGGRLLQGRADEPVAGFSTDTRTLQARDLFFALRGERFDAHRFVGSAIRAGAQAVVIDDQSAAAGVDAAGPAVLLVGDTTASLQALGGYVRRRSGAKVVGITGSAGKTTTKEVTAEFLSARFHVVRSRGNLNNQIGLPLSLLQLRERPDIAVLEIGMNHPGEISRLVALAEPEVRVWTTVAEVHSEFFPSIEAIADAKAEVLEGAGPDTVLVANADDARIAARIGRFPGPVLRFGVDRPADIRATAVRDLGLDGMAADLSTPAGPVSLRTPLLGRGNLTNILAATAVAIQFGISPEEVADRASRLAPAHRRGEILRLARNVVVIDDSYNSNPTAVERILDVLAREAGRGRKLAFLGEMLELGERAVALHEATGRRAAAAKLDALVTVGGAPAVALAETAVRAGLPRASVTHLETSEAAADLAAALVQPGDLVLVKGSRGVRMEAVVDRLKGACA